MYMAQPPINEPSDAEAIEDYKQQARDFLAKSWEYLATGDLHQASEKGWGAAAWMTKAVAVAQNWQYDQHAHFNVVLNNVLLTTNNDRLLALREIANGLHRNYYTRKQFLNISIISRELNAAGELLDILEPLTEPSR